MKWRATTAVLLVLFAGCAVAVDKYPPALTSVLVNGEPPSSLILSSTHDIHVFCQSEGGTPIWWKVPAPSQSFGLPNGSLTIPKHEMDYNDADFYNGDYICFTNNTLGTAVASPIRMRIGVVKLASATERVHLNVNIGETAILQCRTTGVVRPSSLDSELSFVWYWQNSFSTPGFFGRFDYAQMYTQTQGRIAIDEKNRLFIRNVQPSDFNSSTHQFIACRTKPWTYIWAEVDVGKHSLTFVGTASPTLTPTLIYSTPNVTVMEGGSFTLACIFNDVDGKLQIAVTWNKVYTHSQENRETITVSSAQQQHNGTWKCYYKNLTGTIDVFVKLLPRLSGVTDRYAMTGSTVTFACSYQFADTVAWYQNDKEVNESRVELTWSFNDTRAMTLRNVDKNDIGVYSCEAKNEAATYRMNGRLIVTDAAVGNVNLLDAGKPVGTQFTVQAKTTSINVGCSFTGDPLIENPIIVWRMSKFSEDITENTVRPEHGLQKGSVITHISTLHSDLTLKVSENSVENIIGNVTCILKYKVLNAYFSDVSANSVEITKEEGLSYGYAALNDAGKSIDCTLFIYCRFLSVVTLLYINVHKCVSTV